jgi:hypothetical protein
MFFRNIERTFYKNLAIRDLVAALFCNYIRPFPHHYCKRTPFGRDHRHCQRTCCCAFCPGGSFMDMQQARESLRGLAVFRAVFDAIRF